MEYYLAPGALPTVEHASLKLDLYRRDFTVNTLAIALNPGRFGDLIDFFGAQRDLRDRVIRVLHNLSFVEDPTRVYRAVRFEQRLGFRLGEHTENLLRSAVRMGFVERVGGIRLLHELQSVLREAEPLPAVSRLAELQLLPYLHPQLTFSPRTAELFAGAARALHWHELLYTGKVVQRWEVYFLCLVDELDEDDLPGLCTHLDLPKRLRQRLLTERREAHRILQLLERCRSRRREPRASELYHWLEPLSAEILLYLMARTGSDDVRRWLSHYHTHLRGTAPLLDGSDLARLGFPPGPEYKEMLAALLEARLDGKVVTRDDEEALVRKRYRPRSGRGE
jgi:tRNA nucleotidyltransferase (CCA-adding enzyme)